MSRERSEGSYSYPTNTYKTTTCAGASSQTSSVVALPLYESGSIKSMIDNVTPGFKRISAAGGIVNSPMTIVRDAKIASFSAASAVRNAGCTGSTVKRYDWTHYAGTFALGLPVVPDSVLTSLQTEAYTEAVASIDQPDIMGLVEIYESRRTLAALGGIVTDFRKILMGLMKTVDFRSWCRKRNYSVSWSSLTKFLSSEWLRYRYFFLPLFLTGKALHRSLTTKTPPPERKTWRGSASTNINSSSMATDSAGGYFDLKFTSSNYVNIAVSAGVLTELTRGKCLEIGGFGVQHIPSAVWELVSFSFVYDWIANIGDFIAAVSPKVGVRSLASWTTTTITQQSSWQVTATPKVISGWTMSGGGGSGVFTRITKTRTPGGNVGITNRQFNGSWLDFTHLTDALALLRQMSR